MTFDIRYNFSWQYRYAVNLLKDVGEYESSWQGIILSTQKLMTPTGFDQTYAEVLARLQQKTNSAQSDGKTASPGRNILQAVMAWPPAANSIVPPIPRLRASALKFLNHIHLIEYSGARCVWIHSLPREFGNWAVTQFKEQAVTYAAVENLLNSNTDHFSDLQKQDLVGATSLALSWAHRTNMVLATASNAANSNPKEVEFAQALVRRWFADASVTQEELDKFIGILSHGFKAITSTLNRGKLTFTDFVPLRTGSTEEEIRLLNSEAFVVSNRYEQMDIVYIERQFFNSPPGAMLSGKKNWARVIIHELTHLDCNTTDVPFGEKARYAWAGIGPHGGFPGRDAIRNADSWAFFCADCAFALNDAELYYALRKT